MRPLRLLCWQGYDSKEFLAPFERLTGAHVDAHALISDAKTAAALADPTKWRGQFDIVNINNAYVRDYLYPRGLIRPLNRERFAHACDPDCARFGRFNQWAYANDGTMIGITQRLGAFNLVVNTRRISAQTTSEQGFHLASDPANAGRFGLLSYIDFNLFHVCIAADLNPFVALNQQGLRNVQSTVVDWCGHAALINDDHNVLNGALLDGRIDFYISGGVYTAAQCRLEGHAEIQAVTPKQGPIAGHGGVAFVEVTALLERDDPHPAAEAFLAYMQEPAVAAHAAFLPGTHNPVTQCANSDVLTRFSSAQLNAIQWDTLDEELARCADYALMPSYNEVLPILDSGLQRS